MHVLAATGDAWGISEPEFLRRYAALAVITVIATVLVRRWIAHSSAPGPRLVNPDDVAYLHGGPELTVLTTLSALYVAGRITSPERRCVKAVGAVGPDAGELERAIHLSAQHPMPRGELPGTPQVAEALGRIERRLADAGLLLTSAQRRRIRYTGWMLWAVVALGAVRAIADGMAGKPIDFRLVLLVVVVAGAAVLSVTAPRRTGRGNAELTRLRTAHASLSPRLRPHWRVYGSDGAALGVAVFGASALWAADPGLARKLGAPLTLSVGGSGGGGYVSSGLYGSSGRYGVAGCGCGGHGGGGGGCGGCGE